MTLATWRISFPEFRGVPDVQVQAFLDAASLEIDTQIWGPTADQGQAYLTAHRLAASPFGQNAKMLTSPLAVGYKRTTYGQTYLELQIQASSGYRVS
jgi:hypothetical protein